MRLRRKQSINSYLYSTNAFSKTAYKKSLLVISSCENEDHLKAAEKYIGNFLMSLSKQINDSIYETDHQYLEMFKRLKEKLSKKKLSLGW